MFSQIVLFVYLSNRYKNQQMMVQIKTPLKG